MHIFRLMTRWRCWVLAWFALSLGAAIASPLVQPHAWELICGSSGTTVVLAADTAQDPSLDMAGAPGIDCPLCLLVNTPPVPPQVGWAPQPVAHHLVTAVPGRWVAVWTAIPPPARAPPFLSPLPNQKEANYV